MSIFWTLSGSCPLCLTPPCYHLEPPATAALFCDPGIFVADTAGISAIPRAGNYVASFIIVRLDSARASRDAALLSKSSWDTPSVEDWTVICGVSFASSGVFANLWFGCRFRFEVPKRACGKLTRSFKPAVCEA
jgi:hypothetical protein